MFRLLGKFKHIDNKEPSGFFPQPGQKYSPHKDLIRHQKLIVRQSRSDFKNIETFFIFNNVGWEIKKMNLKLKNRALLTISETLSMMRYCFLYKSSTVIRSGYI